MFPEGPDAKSPLLAITIAPGPYQVTIREDPHFPNRTIYVPEKMGLNTSVPILAWENGICYKYGRMYATFLAEIASHGYLVVAPGPPNKRVNGSTTAKWQMDSIDYAGAWTTAPFRPDVSRVAVGGHSCGGMESVTNAAADKTKKIKTILLLNSGGSEEKIRQITAPMLIIHGGDEDVAVPASNDNFDLLADEKPTLPVFKAVLETGHLGSFWKPRGGIYAETVVHWLDWQLKGQTWAKNWFVGGENSPARLRGWSTESSGI
jgi:dienelactone hydrolase